MESQFSIDFAATGLVDSVTTLAASIPVGAYYPLSPFTHFDLSCSLACDLQIHRSIGWIHFRCEYCEL